MKRRKKRRKKLTEADIRALTALKRGALVQTPEGLQCLPVEPTPAERARAIAEHEAWGLSPRVRGNRRPGRAARPAAGSIPACAGEPW